MRNFKSYTAIIVDDHIETLESMKEYLEIEFAKVYSATNAKDALSIILEERPDIIFTDVKMPGEDGFTLIEKIASYSLNIPAVIISAYDDKENLLKAIKLDIVDYIVKPLNSKKLQDTINICFKKLDSLRKDIELPNGYVWKIKESLLFKDGELIQLTESETKLLDLLIRNIDIPVRSIDIFYHLWDNEYKEYNDKSIRNIIYKLRKKLKTDNFIENIYGSKYMIRSKL